MTIAQRIAVIVGVSSAVSAAAGAAAGYFVAMKRLEELYAEQASKEITEAKRYYARLNMEKYQSPADAVAALIPDKDDAAKAILNYQGVTENAKQEVEEIDRNVFTDDPDGVSWEEEVAARTGDEPYILSQHEFLTGESDFEQTTLTYYAGDAVLADERDEAIPNINEVVGNDNIVRFGYKSNDPKVLYIRNDRLSLEFEINLSEGKFAEEVLGLDQRD
jgi:hypothetical protein